MINGNEILIRKYPNVDDEQIQSSGLDLKIGALYELDNKPDKYGLFKDEKVTHNLKEVSFSEYYNDRNCWCLAPHKPYLAEVMNEVRISDDSAQAYFPRSTLLRNGVNVYTAWGDSGYCGKLMFLIINHNNMNYYIEGGVRFAQLVDFQVTGSTESYDGDYQNDKHRRLDEF